MLDSCGIVQSQPRIMTLQVTNVRSALMGYLLQPDDAEAVRNR